VKRFDQVDQGKKWNPESRTDSCARSDWISDLSEHHHHHSSHHISSSIVLRSLDHRRVQHLLYENGNISIGGPSLHFLIQLLLLKLLEWFLSPLLHLPFSSLRRILFGQTSTPVGPTVPEDRVRSIRKEGQRIKKEGIVMMALERKQSPRPIATLLQDGDKETDVGVDPPPIPHPKLLQGWNVLRHH
jgi:hypothetical protein